MTLNPYQISLLRTSLEYFIDAKKDNKKQGYVKIYMPFAQPMTNNDNKKEK